MAVINARADPPRTVYGYEPWMSWRDETAAPVQRELDLLADVALTWAKRFLAKQRGTLVPFAVRLLVDDKTDLLFVDPSEGDGDPTPDAVMDMLYEIATEMRQRGVAIVSVVDTSSGDAVRVELEHSEGGPALVLYLPFRTTRRFRRSVEFGGLQAQVGEHRIWTGKATAQ